MTEHEKELRKALLKANQALEDCIRMHAPEFCKSEDVAETHQRIMEAGGTLAYLTDVRVENLKLLLKPAIAVEFFAQGPTQKQRRRGFYWWDDIFKIYKGPHPSEESALLAGMSERLQQEEYRSRQEEG
jgi:hypothetical protein